MWHSEFVWYTLRYIPNRTTQVIKLQIKLLVLSVMWWLTHNPGSFWGREEGLGKKAINKVGHFVVLNDRLWDKKLSPSLLSSKSKLSSSALSFVLSDPMTIFEVKHWTSFFMVSNSSFFNKSNTPTVPRIMSLGLFVFSKK